jgi:hypothetical protein
MILRKGVFPSERRGYPGMCWEIAPVSLFSDVSQIGS